MDRKDIVMLDDEAMENVSGGVITEDRALARALGNAGLRQNQVHIIKTELGYENGKQVYEVSFEFNHKVFSYMIDANNSNILKQGRGQM